MARVVAIAPDLMFASRIDATLSAAGHQVDLATTLAGATLDDADVLVVDLDAQAADEVVGAGAPVLGFYSHVNPEVRRAAETAGVDLAVPRSRLAREMTELVERLAARAGG